MGNKALRYGIGVAVIATSMALLAGCSSEDDFYSQPLPTGKVGRLTSTIYERGDVPPEEGKKTNNRWTRWIQQNAPVDVKWISIPRWESKQNLNLMFVSGDAPDLILEFDQAIKNELYNQKQLLPLDDLIEKHSVEYKAFLKQNPGLRKVSSMEDGHIYQFGKLSDVRPQHQLWIRLDWLKKLGLEMPKTDEELYTVIKAFREQDPDGNGQKDTYGMPISYIGSKWIEYMYGDLFSYDNDRMPYAVDENGKVYHTWDRHKAVFQFKKRLYDEGLVDKDFLSDSKGDISKKAFINGKLGMYGTGNDISLMKEVLAKNPGAEIASMPMPTTKFGDFAPLISPPFQLTAVVNRDAKDPVAVMKYMDFMMQEKTVEMLQLGEEGVHYKKGADGCPEPIANDTVKTQRKYIADISMAAQVTQGPCVSMERQLNPPEPTEKTPAAMQDHALRLKLAETMRQAIEGNLKREKPMPGLVPLFAFPMLPPKLAINQGNGYKKIYDIMVKSLLAGDTYPVDKAIEDAKEAWKTSNGDAIDKWYAEWYEKNKERVFTVHDIYDYIRP